MRCFHVTRKPDRLRENLGAADIELSMEEVMAIDDALDTMNMSDVFGGSTGKEIKIEYK